MSSSKKFNLTPRQLRFLKFGSLGGVTTLFGITLYYFFLKIVNLDLLIVYPIVFSLSVFFSYILNTYFNYKSPPSLRGLLSYYKSYIISALIGFAILLALKFLLPNWDEFVIAMILVVVRLFMTFFLIEKFLFSGK